MLRQPPKQLQPRALLRTCPLPAITLAPLIHDKVLQVLIVHQEAIKPLLRDVERDLRDEVVRQLDVGVEALRVVEEPDQVVEVDVHGLVVRAEDVGDAVLETGDAVFDGEDVCLQEGAAGGGGGRFGWDARLG